MELRANMLRVGYAEGTLMPRALSSQAEVVVVAVVEECGRKEVVAAVEVALMGSHALVAGVFAHKGINMTVGLRRTGCRIGE